MYHKGNTNHEESQFSTKNTKFEAFLQDTMDAFFIGSNQLLNCIHNVHQSFYIQPTILIFTYLYILMALVSNQSSCRSGANQTLQ